MAEYRGFELLDFLIFLAKRKVKLLGIGVLILVLSYLSIYFLIPPQFDSTALIISSESNDFSIADALGKSLTSSLPLSTLGINFGSNQNYDLFTTLIYSRTNLDKMIKKFELFSDYNTQRIDLARKELLDNIKVKVTPELAYQITIRSKSAQKSVDMVNFIVTEINQNVINLNIKKSKDNRIFLESRLNEIKQNLMYSEDSLKIFQEKTGLFEVETQLSTIIKSYSELESDLIKKEIEQSVLQKIFDKNNPSLEMVNNQVSEINKKLNNIKYGNKGSEILLPIKNLPEEAMSYIRLYRNVKIYSTILEFLIPLYEQAKYQEIKDLPVLQIIDNPVMSEQKSFPPRTLFTIVLTIVIFGIVTILFYIVEIIAKSNNQKIQYLKTLIFNLKDIK